MSDEQATPSDESTTATTPEEPKPLKRADALYYVGETDPVTGEPVQYVMGVPATDLDSEAIKQLTDDEYRTAVETGIYTTEGKKTKSARKE